MTFSTCDICDANEDKLASGEIVAMPPIFKNFGNIRRFSGPVTTLKLFEDNGMVRQVLETPGDGHVLVIDGGGSLRCALVGGNLAVLAEKNGWSGIVVHGCVRDVDEINDCRIGVRALASMPVRSVRKGGGERDVPISIVGVRIMPGDVLYADADGILVAHQQLASPVK